MNKLITKARSGVTLVELLVVILIVTILSVSLLPLLKPFVVEAQYAAEAIPVIGNLRTKIALYQYEHGPLPTVGSGVAAATNCIETWAFSTTGANAAGTVTDVFAPAWKQLNTAPNLAGAANVLASAQQKFSFGFLIDVDNQDLVGKRCKPVHFQYAAIGESAQYCYVLGCFGDDNGLPGGTGYAVCEISVKGADGNVYKQIGTWKRYKAATTGQITFADISGPSTQAQIDRKSSVFCPIPSPATVKAAAAGTTPGKLDMVTWMESYGWEF